MKLEQLTTLGAVNNFLEAAQVVASRVKATHGYPSTLL